ncbi:DUF1674 domain-containing protein [Methylosinus sporium]|uniref:DUF1674 domain-containing protein n=1 Tax=Methylosinus sporium TaxID=428 RepID=A0A549T4G2_METSR|nr:MULTISPECIES: DUF1674 domain-containing protein [Methylosinus]MBU3889200.1 DUF1674 domain-containing protein [Methylosinus sp. KRF6]TRL36670.1 DUF1674 domain-containing protein [Methylosinus sporium]
MTEAEKSRDASATPRPPEALPPVALRALAEAEERRARAARETPPAARELGGRGGLDPARYGDWESKGIASDF